MLLGTHHGRLSEMERKSLLQAILQETLGLDREYLQQEDVPLLDAVPQLDSASALQVLLLIEERFNLVIPDDAVTAESFVDLRSLETFVSSQIARASA